MARGYLIDPATGMPAVQTPSGGLLPLSATPADLEAAGIPRLPDMRVAGPGGAPTDISGDIPQMPPPTPEQALAAQAAPFRQALAQAGGAPAPNVAHEARPPQPDWMPRGEAAKGPGAVDPSSLAMGAPPQQAPQQGPGGNVDPLVQRVIEEEYAKGRGGGGGPRRLGVTSETRKMTEAERPMDPVLAQQAVDAQNASDAYNEQLAISLNQRQQQAYEMQQGEYAARAGQLKAQQERFQAQQTMLQDYAAKRDAAMAEAASLKAPQLEDYWGSRTQFAQVAAGLAVALGGALQGLRGGNNPGLDMVNQSIDRWVAEQREQYQRAVAKGNAIDNQYAKMVQLFGSENLAAEHMREQAWTVRDTMMGQYAQKVGTPSALEAYNQAMLQSEAQRAQLRAQASQGAAVEIEQKLSMQGGGGGGRPSTLAALQAGAKAKEALGTIQGEGKNPERSIANETAGELAGALDTIVSARGIQSKLQRMGYANEDTDDPRAGAYDYVTKNIPGTETRRIGQDLDIETEAMARGMQQFLGKSDNDAMLAERQARGLGGSGRERNQAAQRAEAKASRRIKLALTSMTPDQRRVYLQSLPPDLHNIVQGIVGQDTTPAASETVVK